MKRYKGYYIDGVYFHNEQEIDDFCKSEIIRKIKIFHDLLFDNTARYNTADQFAILDEIHSREIKLHDEYKMSWKDIEEIPYR